MADADVTRTPHFILDDDDDADLEDDDPECMCEYLASCGGLGSLTCDGWGGDQCVCRCGGGLGECPGCQDSDGLDEANFDDDEDDDDQDDDP